MATWQMCWKGPSRIIVLLRGRWARGRSALGTSRYRGVDGSLGEVHHRNEAEDAQGQDEVFFRSLVQSALGVLGVFDADGIVT